MTRPLEGVRVVEVAGWTFVPGAGAILSDLGADVIKVEPPVGDPQRGLKNMLNVADGDVNPFNEVPNRGKRSMTIDLSHPQGRDVLLKVVETADVFLTSTLSAIRERMGIGVKALQEANPRLIYVRGSGWGDRGPMRDVGGFDFAAAYFSSSAGYKLTQNGNDPPIQPPAFFDLPGSVAIAGAVGMALYQREKTGHGSIVDVSLLSVGMWTMGMDIAAAPFVGEIAVPPRTAPGNPITNTYRTSDDRWLVIVALQADRYWAELMGLIGREDLISDPRFCDAAVRFANREDCVKELDRTFGEHDLATWMRRLASFTGVWAPALKPAEVLVHAQVEPNGFLADVTTPTGTSFQVVSPPMQFNNAPGVPPGPAPELGQHTEEILLDAGLNWDDISAYRESGALG